MNFTLSHATLVRLCTINSFEVPPEGMVFFGLRGCLPVDDDDHTAAESVELRQESYDHRHPRCTLGQWQPALERVAVFPGSTVPHQRHVRSALARSGRGANMMMTGCYDDYRKGRHKAGKPTGHAAFRQTGVRAIRRTADDLDYDNDDRVEFTNPFDNLHAAWCMGVEAASFASAGCQVVVGYPKCPKRGNKPDAGPWAVFRERAYALEQTSYPYILLNGRDAARAASRGTQKQSARLRFGSQGKLVEELQKVLKSEDYYEGRIDGQLGPRSLKAVLEFQTAQFGDDQDDGIVGPMTASALSLSWPAL